MVERSSIRNVSRRQSRYMIHSYSPPWLSLKEVLASAESSFYIASPFISSGGISFLDRHLPASVSLKVVSQFTPENISSGFLDIPALYSLCCNRSDVSFFHCSRLHAKIYSSNSSSIVGSFNLTARGLGIATDCNFEAYTLLDRKNPYVDSLVHVIDLESDAVSPLLMRSLLLAEPRKRDAFSSFSDVSTSGYWFPAFRRPHLLYRYYSASTFSPSSSAAFDLNALVPPLGLAEEEFNQYIRFAMLRYPIIRSMLASKVVSLASLTEALLNTGIDQKEYGDTEQLYVTLYRWISCFFPEFSGKAEYYLESEQSILPN